MHAGDPSVVARRESSARSYSRWVTPVLGRAKGSLIWSRDGARHIDFLAGAGSLNYGHNDDDMKAALLDYISADGIAHGLDMTTDAKLGFLSAFEEHILRPRELDYHCQFTGPTGANAIEAAIKLARRVTGRSQVIAFTRAFHGVSAGALAATANSYFRGSGHGLHGVTRLPYDGYLGSVDTAQLIADMLADPASGIQAPAAILLETVQGEGGLASASNAWLRTVARIAREVGALLIVDDIQAGCGRTGTFFSFERSGIVPDLVALSKSLSGYGLPMSLLCIRPRWDSWKPGEHKRHVPRQRPRVRHGDRGAGEVLVHPRVRGPGRGALRAGAAPAQRPHPARRGGERQGPRHDAGPRCRVGRAGDPHPHAVLRGRPHHRDLRTPR